LTSVLRHGTFGYEEIPSLAGGHGDPAICHHWTCRPSIRPECVVVWLGGRCPPWLVIYRWAVDEIHPMSEGRQSSLDKAGEARQVARMKKILRILGIAIRFSAVLPIVLLCIISFAIDWFVQPAKSHNTPITDRIIALGFFVGRTVTKYFG
jgi:hypothetical protein